MKRKKMRNWKRILSVALSAVLLFGMNGTNTVQAVGGNKDTTNLCEHHTEHTADCYASSVSDNDSVSGNQDTNCTFKCEQCKESNSEQQIVTGFVGFNPSSWSPLTTIKLTEKSTIDKIGLPEKISATIKDTDGETEIPVTWKTIDGSDYETAQYETFDFEAVLAEGYKLADGVELPYITVNISEMLNSNAKTNKGEFESIAEALAANPSEYDTFTVTGVEGTTYTYGGDGRLFNDTSCIADYVYRADSGYILINSVSGEGVGMDVEMTLNNASLNGRIYSIKDLTIHLEGTNSITNGNYIGIYIGGSLTIDGNSTSDTLSVEITNNGALGLNNGSLTVTGNAHVTAKGVNGIVYNGTITVNTGASLTAISTAAGGVPYNPFISTTVTGGGTFTAYADISSVSNRILIKSDFLDTLSYKNNETDIATWEPTLNGTSLSGGTLTIKGNQTIGDTNYDQAIYLSNIPPVTVMLDGKTTLVANSSYGYSIQCTNGTFTLTSSSGSAELVDNSGYGIDADTVKLGTFTVPTGSTLKLTNVSNVEYLEEGKVTIQAGGTVEMAVKPTQGLFSKFDGAGQIKVGTATYDTSGNRTSGEDPTVTQMTFQTLPGPSELTTVSKGAHIYIIANLQGTNISTQLVTWSIEGNSSSDTKVGFYDADQYPNAIYLDVGADEENNFTLKAVPKADPTKSFTVIIEVEGVTPPPSQTYTVTFDEQGGSEVVDISNISNGSKITKPANPTFSGYTFGGWYKESACNNPWDFDNDTVTANITLYAKWTQDTTPEPVKYAITVNGGSANPASAAQGETVTITANAPSDGQQFKEWTSGDGVIFADANSVSTTFDMLAKPVTVTATYEAVTPSAPKYTVTVQNDGNGTATADVSEAASGTVITPTATPNSNYRFSGWQTVSGGITVDSNNQFTMPAGNVVIKALFESTQISCSHAQTELRNALAATCTTAGYTGDTYCKDCGTKTATGTTVQALEHQYTSTVTKEPTVSEEGVRTYTCIRSGCGHSYTESIAKLPDTSNNSNHSHSHGYSAAVTTDATCTEAGVRTYSCSCGSTYTESITAIGHDYRSSVTRQPTTAAAGVMTYTCTRCGNSYTSAIARLQSVTPTVPSADSTTGSTASTTPEENRPDTGMPFIAGETADNSKTGWDTIRETVVETKEGESLVVDLNGATVVPGEVLDDIRGKDVTLVLDMGNGISWSINGQNITAGNVGDIDFAVKVETNNIPVDVINNVTGERESIQISLDYEGEFGFAAVLTINLEEKNAGLFANLYYFNAVDGQMEFICAAEIAEDGTTELDFTHASDYAIIIDETPATAGEIVEAAVSTEQGAENTAPSQETEQPQDTEQSQSATWVIVLIAVVILICLGGFVFLRTRKKSQDDEL